MLSMADRKYTRRLLLEINYIALDFFFKGEK